MILAMLCLNGCSGGLDREFSSITPHFKQDQEWQNISDYTINSFSEVSEVIEKLIASGMTEGVVWVNFKDSSLENKLTGLCHDIQISDPVAAFAVEQINFDLTQFVVDLRLRFFISYSRPQKEIFDIKPIYTHAEFLTELKERLSSYGDRVILYVQNYSDMAFDINGIFEEAYFDMPDYTYGIQGIKYALYPDNGEKRIIEIDIKRDKTADIAKNFMRMVSFSADNIISKLPVGGNGYERAVFLHDYLLTATEYQSKTTEDILSSIKHDSYTAYGALVENKAVDEGYALAYKKLCDLAGIDCRVVLGSIDGVPHVWNLVLMDDGCWYHVDCAADDSELLPSDKYFMLNDEKLALTHSWQRGAYPKCSGLTYVSTDETVETAALSAE